MNPKLANATIIGFEIIAIVLAIHITREFLSLRESIATKQSPLTVDTGLYYLLLMLIFPWLHFWGILTKKSNLSPKKLTVPTTGFFLGLALLSWSLGRSLDHSLRESGYQACPTQTQHRISPGKKRL